MSPFGATLIWRGPFNPEANSSALNPAGTLGMVAGGRGTRRELFAEEGVAPGRGRSPGLMRRITPGLSRRQSPNAAPPTSGPGSATAPATIKEEGPAAGRWVAARRH